MKVSVPYTHKFHPNPRLSAGQLGDYLQATSPIARRSILREAKYPSVGGLMRYDDAKKALVEHLSAPKNEEVLTKWLHKLELKATSELTPYQAQNCKLCIEALATFQEVGKKVKGSKIEFEPTAQRFRLKWAGVDISISIDAIAKKIIQDGEKMGGVILVICKPGSNPKEIPDRCKTAAMLTFRALSAHPKYQSLCDPSLCMAIDVYQGQVYKAKAQQKLLSNAVGTSCEEVATQWPTVKPPQNYYGPPLI